MNDAEILNGIALALESRGYVHCCNGEAIGKIIDDLKRSSEDDAEFFRRSRLPGIHAFDES